MDIVQSGQGDMLEATVQFQARSVVALLYAVKQGRARKLEDAFWKSSATAPCKDFIARSGLEPNKNLVGQKLFASSTTLSRSSAMRRASSSPNKHTQNEPGT